jgi:hypothetical protein
MAGALDPELCEVAGKLQARARAEGLRAVASDLPAWAHSWATWSYGWIDADVARDVRRWWTPRAGDLPLPPPELQKLRPPRIEQAIEIPEVLVETPRSGLAAVLFRNARSAMYGVLSLAALVGLRGAAPAWLLAAAALAAVLLGLAQARREREAEVDKARATLLERARAANRAALASWQDRCEDALTADLVRQGEERRAHFLRWYRGTALPKIAEHRESDTAIAAARNDAAKRLQEAAASGKDVERFLRELDALGKELEAVRG